MSTVLITGTSSGFGKLAALQFARKGDSVFASMRNTAKGAELEEAASKEKLSLKVIQLDVLSDGSVRSAVGQVLAHPDRDRLLRPEVHADPLLRG